MKSSHRSRKYAVEAWNWNKSWLAFSQKFSGFSAELELRVVKWKIPVWDFHSFFTFSALRDPCGVFNRFSLCASASNWTKTSSRAPQLCRNMSINQQQKVDKFVRINYETFIRFFGVDERNLCVLHVEREKFEVPAHTGEKSCFAENWEFIFHFSCVFSALCSRSLIHKVGKVLKLNLQRVYEKIKFQVVKVARESTSCSLISCLSSRRSRGILLSWSKNYAKRPRLGKKSLCSGEDGKEATRERKKI